MSLTFAAYIKGTVNDPAEYPAPNAAHGSYHWVFERVIAVSLIPLFAAATVKHGTCGMVDASLSVALLLHSHMGFEQVLIDYVEKRKFPKAALLRLRPLLVFMVRTPSNAGFSNATQNSILVCIR